MKIRFWGVRGSIPVPGEATVKYGGNTACVEVVTESGESLVLDAGSGIRELGLDYIKRENRSKVVNLFLSHAHWDHIQGFPFFIPAMTPGMEVHIYSSNELRDLLATQMSLPFHPLGLSELNPDIHFHEVDGSELEVSGCRIKPIVLEHPQRAYGYRITGSGKTIVYSSDTENRVGELKDAYIEAVSGADVLLYDAQYTPEEYTNGRIGWGHSTYEVAAEVAVKAGVGKLVLFHHEPTHDDDTIDRIEKEAKELFPNTVAAREGMILMV